MSTDLPPACRQTLAPEYSSCAALPTAPIVHLPGAWKGFTRAARSRSHRQVRYRCQRHPADCLQVTRSASQWRPSEPSKAAGRHRSRPFRRSAWHAVLGSRPMSFHVGAVAHGPPGDFFLWQDLAVEIGLQIPGPLETTLVPTGAASSTGNTD